MAPHPNPSADDRRTAKEHLWLVRDAIWPKPLGDFGDYHLENLEGYLAGRIEGLDASQQRKELGPDGRQSNGSLQLSKTIASLAETLGYVHIELDTRRRVAAGERVDISPAPERIQVQEAVKTTPSRYDQDYEIPF